MQLSGSILALILLSELVLFAILAQKLHQGLYTFFYRLTGSEKTAARFFAVFFLPGTFIHELSHFVMARVLFVNASGLELKPVLHDDGLKLGSVSIAKSDPFRRLLIGGAPFLFGMALITGSLFWLYQNFRTAINLPWWVILLLLFVYFQIGNTMFSSRKDMEGALMVFLFFSFLLILIYLVYGSPPFLWIIRLLDDNRQIFATCSLLVGVPVTMNLGVLLIMKVFKLAR